MKLVALLFLTIPVLLSAQTYVPFISTTDSSDIWMDMNSCTNMSCFDAYTNRYTIEGDTMIGSYQYSKVYIKTKHQHGSDQSQWCSEYVNYYEYFYGGIRESGKKIYVTPNSFGPGEYLAYDFNLSIGDTLPSPDGNPSAPAYERIINTIDSVLVFGDYRKRYTANNNHYVIEGIGASSGLFNPMVYSPSYCFMQTLCYAEYGTPDHFLQNCNLNLSIEELDKNDKSKTLVKIVDYLGRETKEKPNTPLIYIYDDGSTEKIYRVEQ